MASGRMVARRALTLALVLSSLAGPAAAQQAKPGIVRDAETEALLRDYVRPIFKAAGVRSQAVQLYLVNDPAFNAFVANGEKIFINTGTIVDAKTPNEMIGVLAHETGHLAGNHQVRFREQVERAKTMALIGGLVGMGAALAGAIAGSGDAARAGGGVAIGSNEIVRRNLLAYQRTEEMAADRSAINYLEKTGQSAKGMIDTFHRLADQMSLSSRNANPYLQSHPMPVERIELLDNLATGSKFYQVKDPPALQARHDMVRAKLSAFSESPSLAMRRYPLGDTSMPARYAHAVVAYRLHNTASALAQMQALIKAEPANPYFYELLGQTLYESGRARDSLPPLRKAVSLAPSSGLIRILLGQALVEAGDKASVDEAVKNLTVGLQSEGEVPIGYRSLARAYAIRGDIPMADLATAQGEFAEGDFKDARMHAERAQTKLKTGSPAWLRADDIVSYTPPKLD